MRIKKGPEAKHEATRTPATASFVERAISGSLPELLRSISAFPRPWSENKGDLFHWIPLLNVFDLILSRLNAVYDLTSGPQLKPFGTVLLTEGVRDDESEICLEGASAEHLQESENDETLICQVLDFTKLLLDNCANRNLYNSSEQAEPLLNSTSLRVVACTLHAASRFAAYYHHAVTSRHGSRQSLSQAHLQSHYRIDHEKVLKLAEPFAANLVRQVDTLPSQSQSSSGKGRESPAQAKKPGKQAPKIHPNDLLSFVRESSAAENDFSEFSAVNFDLSQSTASDFESAGPQAGIEREIATNAQLLSSPTPVRRTSGPSRLGRSSAVGDSTASQAVPGTSEGPLIERRNLVISPTAVQRTDIHELLSTYLPRVPKDLHFAFLCRLRSAKALADSQTSRQLSVVIRILALINVAFLYPENLFQQKVLHRDSQEPRQLQPVYQLADLVKAPSNGTDVVPQNLRSVALEALDAIAIRQRGKHTDIHNALGVNVSHGSLFQLLRGVVEDLRSEAELDAAMFDWHEKIFFLLDSLLPKSDIRNPHRVDTLVSSGLFGVLVEILSIHSAKAQRTQNRVLSFINDGIHAVRDGIRAFANASGLDAVSELIAWEVQTCLDAVQAGSGIPDNLKPKNIDYQVPIWHQHTLRTLFKFVNHMLSHSNANTDRLLRNLIDTPSLLNAVNSVLRNGRIFGSNIYGNAINMVSTFIHNEPTSYAVIAEAGISKSLLNSVTDDQPSVPARSRAVPIKRVPGSDEVVCGTGSEMETLKISHDQDKILAAGILPSSDVLLNLPQAFGAICLNQGGMDLFLNSHALESYFEVFESSKHVKSFASDPSLAGFVGNAFDELVRHHPRLKTAVLHNIIMTIARIDHRCRYLMSAESGARLHTTESAHEVRPMSRSVTFGEEDISMADVIRETTTSTEEVLSTEKDPDVAVYVGSFCKFLTSFFANQNMATSFMEQGGLQFLLDLCSLPTLPFNIVKESGYDSIFELPKAVHMVAELKPHLALPPVMKYASDALDQLRPLLEHNREESFFHDFIWDAKIAAGATALVKAMVQLHLYVSLLQEIMGHPIFGRDRNVNVFTQVNLADMYIDIVRRLGLLSRFCVWESILLLGDLPDSVRSKTSLRNDGIGDDANQILGVSRNLSLRMPPNSDSTNSQSEPSNTNAVEGQSSAENAVTKAPLTHHFSAAQVQNVTIIRHLITTIPFTISGFFHNLGEKLAQRRRVEPYLRQNAYMVAEALADAGVSHLDYELVQKSTKQGWKYAYWIVVLDMIKRVLNLSEIETAAAHSCVTIVLQALRNRGALERLKDILKMASKTLLEGEEIASQPSVGESQKTVRSCARAVMQLTLTMYSCMTSHQYIVEAHQSQMMVSADRDQTHQNYFNSGQFLVELRSEILPQVQEIWTANGSEHLSSGSLRKLIRIIQVILNSEGESHAFKSDDDVVTRERSRHKPYQIVRDREEGLTNLGFDVDLAREALYRCLGNREFATEYCQARGNLNLPRLPLPNYDVELKAETAASTLGASLQRRDSQSTIPDPEADEAPRLQARMEAGSSAAGDTPLVPSDNIDLSASQVTGRSPPEADGDDGRIAMSIDNLLNLTDQNQPSVSSATPVSSMTAAGRSSGVKNHNENAHPPIEISMHSGKVSVEQLDAKRIGLRKTLIDRVIEILGAHDTLTFELADLLGASTSIFTRRDDIDDAEVVRQEYGEALIQMLISYDATGDFRADFKTVAAGANLLAILLQQRDFWGACLDDLIANIDSLLPFVKVFQDSAAEGSPWIGQILLLFERLLSDELQPEQIVWQAPTTDTVQPDDGIIANYVKPHLTDDQRSQLFDSIVKVLPYVGKDQSLALSCLRILMMLTRHRSIAEQLAAKHTLQKLFVMVKQLAGITNERLQGCVMLILRHIIEDDETIRRAMRNAVLDQFTNGRSNSGLDTTAYVRFHHASILRSPRIFLEVTNELLKLHRFNHDQRPQMLFLKPDVTPLTFLPWETANNAARPEKPVEGAEKPIENLEKLAEGDEKPQEGQNYVLPSTEAIEASETTEKAKAEIKPPVVEHPDGIIHFLLSQLLSYKDVEDKEADAPKTRSYPRPGSQTSDVEMDGGENTSDEDSASGPAAETPVSQTLLVRPENARREEYRAEDHPIYHYRCFLLQCLTELLMSYNQAKIEFINFSRKADPKVMTPSKPRSGVLNYLLNSLIPNENLERSTSVSALKRQGTSVWAMSVVVALCMRTPETYSTATYGGTEREARDSDLLFVRKFVIEHAIKAYKDIQGSTEYMAEEKYARMLSVSDLFHRFLIGRVTSVHSSAGKQHGEPSKQNETEIARIMFEKNLISVLTVSLSEIDLAVPGAKRAIKYILKPLKILTQTAISLSQNSDLSTTPGQTTDEDEISTATSVSDVTDDREETPDLFRHSALGMLERGRERDDESPSESDNEDEEMYENEYDDGMDYEEEIDPADDDEAVSDTDDENHLHGHGPIEGHPGDMPMDIEVVVDGDDDISDEDDDGDSEESDEESDEDEDMDGGEIEVLDEIEEERVGSLDGDNEDEWEDEPDEDENEIGDDDEGPEMVNEHAMDQEAQQIVQELGFNVTDGPPIIRGPGFADLEEDIETGRYMADLRMTGGDEDDEEDDDDEDEEGEELMYDDGYDDNDDEDEPYSMMDEALGFLQNHRHHSHAGNLPPGFRSREIAMVTPDGRPSAMFRQMRTHNRSGPERSRDDGMNPLLQRSHDDSHPSALGRRGPFPPGDFGDWMQTMVGPDRPHRTMNTLLHNMVNAVGGGIFRADSPLSGAVWTTMRPEELEVLISSGERPPADFGRGRSSREDITSPPPFVPTSTIPRWQEEARLMFPGNHVAKSDCVINSILRLLVPPAIEEQRLREAEEAKQREEARKRAEEEEKQKQEEEARLQKEREEKEAREREEEARRQEEEAAARAAADVEQLAEQSAEANSNTDAMQGIESTGEEREGPDHEEDADAGPAQEQPRVVATIRNREVDITNLGIDQDYLEALPEELREEVLMQALSDRQQQSTNTNEAPAEIDPQFLDALPEDLREEILAQDAQDRRRRERRREQEAAGNAPRGEEMDTGSFLASLDENLRRTVLMDQALDAAVLENLPARLQQEARDAFAHAEARQREFEERYGPRMGGGFRTATQPFTGEDPGKRTQRRQIVQMLDKSGIATVLRLLFVPQQGSLKESLNTVLQNLSQNRQSRGELISLLLSILQDGSADTLAVERSYANITLRSKQANSSQTPRPLKRSLTGNLHAPLSQDMTPIKVIQQCLSSLNNLVQNNAHAQTFFLNPHETASTIKGKNKQKGKGKDNPAQKYALNALLGLLDRKMIMDDAECMDQLSSLLVRVTHPLNVLRRQEKEADLTREAEQQEGPEQAAGDNPADSAEAGTDGPRPSAEASGVAPSTQAEKSTEETKDGAIAKEGKKSKPVPPVVPEHNLQLVINIITARECSSKTFRDTLSTIKNMSVIPDAKEVFGKELVHQAQGLGVTIAGDLSELLAQLSKRPDDMMQSPALSKFSPASSDQTKLLRVLTALDYMFDPKRSGTDHITENDATTAGTKANLLSSLHESPTFTPVWAKLSDCLKTVSGKAHMMSVATTLLPLIEGLMVVCKNTALKDNAAARVESQQFSVSSPEPESSIDTLFFQFTGDHRKILNELVRNNPRLMSGTFSLLVKNPKVLEFDNKRNYFQRRLHNRDEHRRPHGPLSISVKRDSIFWDSFRALFFRKPDELKYGKLNIRFVGEEGVDAGGVTREWFQQVSRQMFNPDFALFNPVASDRTTFHPNPLSYVNDMHLQYFKFIGRIIGKALYEGRPLDCHFSRAVYKRMLGRPVSLKDMETVDRDYYNNAMWTLENDIDNVLFLTFSHDIDNFGDTQTIDLIDNGREIQVTDENKENYIQKMIEYRLTGAVEDQLKNFLEGFHDIVPENLISIFNEQELELLISGLPEIEVDDWKANTEYHSYTQTSPAIQWFWRAVRSFDKEERAKLLQFVTGTSKVPLNGFKELEGMNGFSKFNIHRDFGDKERLPSSHTCFNQLDLPEYDDYETLRSRLYTAMTAGGEYFGFA